MRGTTRGTAGWLAIIVVVAVAVSLLVRWKTRGEAGHLRALLAAEIDRGSLVGLARAQVIELGHERTAHHRRSNTCACRGRFAIDQA